MKKRFISLVVAAALVGEVAAVSTPVTASAGTVAVKGDTKVQIYGFINYMAGWVKKMEGTQAGFINMPDLKGTNDNTKFASTTERTRLGLNFKNEDANLTGKFEGDFVGGTFRLRRAFVKHQFDNFYVLIGQEWGIEEVHRFSDAKNSPAGFNGHTRMPQVQIGTNLDLNGATLGLALALEDKDYMGNGKIVVKGADNGIPYTHTYYIGLKKRETMPGIAARANLGINTGFGNPAQVYAWGLAEPVKINVPGTYTDPSLIKEKSEAPVVFGAGFSLPVSMVTVQSEYIYGKGTNKFAGLTAYNDDIPSYYADNNGNVKANKFNAFNIEAKVAPMPNVSVAGGYDYLKFTKNVPGGYDKPKVETYFGNIAYNTTKYTKLVLEWDHVKGETEGNNSSSVDGNMYWLSYTYSF